MTTRVDTSVETDLGSLAVCGAGDYAHRPDVESAVVVVAGAVVWQGGTLRVGDGVYGPCRFLGTARLLVLRSRYPATGNGGVAWRYAPAGRTADRFLDVEGGFADMHVRWLASGDTLGTRGIVVATSTFEPGGRHDLHRHPNADEFFLVLRGGGHHLTANGPLRLDPGGLVHVPAGEPHGFRTDPDTVTTALYGYLGAGSLEQAGYELVGGGR